jgi:hypothetical protein
MSGNGLGLILVVTGLALIAAARWRIAKIVQEEERALNENKRDRDSKFPYLQILLGGLAVIAGLLLWA